MDRERERERERESERERVCVCVCAREIEKVCVCARAREKVSENVWLPAPPASSDGCDHLPSENMSVFGEGETERGKET